MNKKYLSTGVVRPIIIFGIVHGVLLLAQGCATKLQTAANERIDATQARSEAIQGTGSPNVNPPKLLSLETLPRFTTHSIALERSSILPPHIQSVTFRLPGRHNLTTIADILSRSIGITVIMQPDALMSPLLFAPTSAAATGAKWNPEQQPTDGTPSSAQLMQMGATRIGLSAEQASATFELNYNGPLQALLDQIANQAQLQWTYEDSCIVFRRIVTRSIPLKIVPGVNKQPSSQAMGAGGGFDTSPDSDLLANIEKTLGLLISSQGQINVNKSIGQITVRDAVANVREVERYLNQLQAQLLRQVSIKVEVLQVDLSSESQTELNWSNIAKEVAGLGKITLVSPSGNGIANSSPASIGITNGDSSIFVKALEKYGRVSSTYSTMVNTLHRQPVPVAVTNNITYVRSITAPTVSTVGASVGQSVLVSELITGFSLTLLPIVLDSNRVLMQSSLGLNSLRELKVFSVGTGVNQASVQQPNVDIVGSNQRTNLRSGETMILLGYNYEDARATNADIIKDIVPTSKVALSSKKSVLILITPLILDY